MKEFGIENKKENEESAPKKKYKIGGWVFYEENKDAPVGYPNGIEIEASSQEEADKAAKEMCEAEAKNRYNGSVHEFWAKEIE